MTKRFQLKRYTQVRLPHSKKSCFCFLLRFFADFFYHAVKRLDSISFGSPWPGHTINKLYIGNLIKLRSRDMFDFDFLEKDLGVAFAHSLHDFSRKIFLKLSSDEISLPNFTSWDIGQYAYSNYCFPSRKRHKFEINFSFLIKTFSYMTKQVRAKLKYLKNEKSFKGEIKIFFLDFKSFSL